MSKSGAQLITDERQRQLNEEGWTVKRDTTEHPDGELALVAALYATPIKLFKIMVHGDGDVSIVDPWPWYDTIEITRYSDGSTTQVKAWDKRNEHPRLRKLVIAGALIAAEIDRINHSSKNTGVVGE